MWIIFKNTPLTPKPSLSPSHSQPTPPIVYHLTSMCVGYDEGNHFPKKIHQITLCNFQEKLLTYKRRRNSIPPIKFEILYLTTLRVKIVYRSWLCTIIFCFFVLKLKFVNNVCFGGCWTFLLSCPVCYVCLFSSSYFSIRNPSFR